ncbi:molybdenum ABC transporter ATP-binding protein [Phyllobacterium sp. YR531]|uniref:molybdenum ABC transporter ATP-binding protein n=1 Tax=Phyllobacterium sp. YR531 TaxID=1144343 RepID=UPI00026F7E97|nr:molybdenum ABC transporter ATP-binding protein [Phyllobacterium sp. YR531]EJN01675.1 molybdenum ABC transporter, ATP-binding protein [Phyllobacterium sp. YR531]
MRLEFEARGKLGAFQLDVAFTSDGGVTALFGPSGSGKTSVIRMLAGLSRPDEGRIIFDGEVVVDTSRKVYIPRHKRQFGVVFQDDRLFPHLSVSQNLKYGRWFAGKSRHVDNFHTVVDLLGLNALLDRRPGNLSGGEKQRVAIGRALLSSPRLLLMDEPLAALDEARKEEILPYLEALRDRMNIPIIYVSHSVREVARLADKVVVLANGSVGAAGEVADVLNQSSVSSVQGRKEAGTLIEGKVTRYDPKHNLSTIEANSSQLFISGADIGVGKTIRMYILAKDVMLSTIHPQGISALNVLEGKITSILSNSEGTMDVHIDCRGTPLLSRITTLASEHLSLRQGMTVFAIIKTVALEPR